MARKPKRKKPYLNPAQIVQTFTQNLPEVLLNYMDHKRLKVYLHKGLECVTCGVAGDRLVLWYDYSWKPEEHALMSKGLHIDLLAGDVLMTVDHIYPKSLGGRDTLENLQPMCENCNGAKGAKFEFKCEVCSGTDFRISKRGNPCCDGPCEDVRLAIGKYPSKEYLLA